MIANLLDGIEVCLNTDYLENKTELDALADKVVYTGPIDAYFDYKLGTLEYRSVRFETEVLDKPNFQGNAAVNYTDRETPWTRIIEHKWFEFGKDENGNPLTNSFECYRNYPTAGTEKTPVAQHLALRVLTLPLYADLPLEDVNHICDIILN